MIFFSRTGNTKWEKRPQLYKGRFFRLRRILEFGLGACAVLFIAGVIVYFQRSDALFIRNIIVTGDLVHVTRGDIIDVSGIRPSDKLFGIDLRIVTRRLKKLPWVERAVVRREFPDTIQIFVGEHRPVALLRAGDLYYVSAKGVVFKKTGAEDSLDYPVMSSFDPDFARNFPRLAERRLRQTLDFMRLIADGDFYRANAISEVVFDPAIGFTVYTVRDGVEIHYGDGDFTALQDKLERYARSPIFDKARVVRIDLAARAGVIVRKLMPAPGKV